MMKTIKIFLFLFFSIFSLQVLSAEAGTGLGSITVAVAPSYTVTATATSGGTITPSSQSIISGGTAVFNVTPISTTDYTTTVTGCNGTLAPFNNPGTTYTTGPITSNCTVSAVFTKKISPPTGLSATQSTCLWNSGQLVVSWNAVSGATSYTLKEGSTTLYTGNATSYKHINLMPLSSHTYTVTASNTTGTSSASTVTGKTLDVCPTASPKNFSATPGACGTGTINLSWTKPDSSTTLYCYNIMDGTRHVSKDSNPNVTVCGSSNTSYVDSGLTASSSHNYSLTAGLSVTYPDKTSHWVISDPVTVSAIAPSACSYTVSATAGTGGKVSPASQSITSGAKAIVTVTPNSGYAIDTVTGCAGNGSSLSGNTYTTAPVTANCTVSATFKPATTPTCSNGATNYPTCTTCASGSTMISGTCTPVTVSVNASPTTYSTTPNGSVSFKYTATTNSGTTECRLLDFSYSPLNSSYQASSPIIRSAPSAEGSYGYYVQCRNTSVTSVSANSNMITVNVVASGSSCSNGATNYPTCTIGSDGKCLNGANNPPTCTTFNPCSNGANNPPTCTTFNTCSNGATNYPTCTIGSDGKCLNGANNPPTCTTFTVMSGTLTASNCTINQNSSSCNSSLVWNTVNPIATSSVTTPSSITVGTGNSGTKTYAVSTGPGSRNFYLYNNGTLLAQAQALSSCASGTNWSTTTGTCIASTEMSGNLSASDCQIAEGGDSCLSTINWSTTNPISTSAVTTPNSITVGTGNSGTKTYEVSVGPGSRNFYLYNNGTLLYQDGAISSCVSGTEWNGSACVAVKVDGGWSDEYCGPCDTSTGYMECSKVCNNPAPANGGASCSGGDGYALNYTRFCSSGDPATDGGSGIFSINFTATPDKIFKGRSSVLEWSSTADSCTGTGFDTGGKANSSDLFTKVVVNPTKTTTYTLTCNGAADQQTEQREVKVNSITVIER